MHSVDVKNRNYAMAGTILAHVLLVLLLLICTLVVPVPLPGDIKMELELEGGIIDAGGGGGGSNNTAAVTESASLDEESTPSELTNDNAEEDAPPANVQPEKPVVNNTKPNHTTKPTNTTKPVNNTKPLNPNANFPGMQNDGNGNGDGDGNGDGNGNGTGNGSGNGNGDGDGNGDGNGNKPGTSGFGGDYQMAGRLLKYKPSINEKVQNAGRVVINIWVNQDGKVTRTYVNEQFTNTPNKQLRDLALEAAKKTTWSAKSDAAPEQKGTITFNFTLN